MLDCTSISLPDLALRYRGHVEKLVVGIHEFLEHVLHGNELEKFQVICKFSDRALLLLVVIFEFLLEFVESLVVVEDVGLATNAEPLANSIEVLDNGLEEGVDNLSFIDFC